MKRVIEQHRVFFKKEKDTYVINENHFTGKKYWEIVYTQYGVIQITFWSSTGKPRNYSNHSLPKVIRTWLTVQGIPEVIDYQVGKKTTNIQIH